MDHAFLSGASATPPSAPVSPSIGYPTAGNPGTGTPPTSPGPWLYHMLIEEIRNVIVAGGITPDQTAVNQLLLALRSAGVFTTQSSTDNSTKVATTAWAKSGFLVSLASNGYIKFPDWMGGLIIQWGQSGNIAANSSQAIAFPIAFPVGVKSLAMANAYAAASATITASIGASFSGATTGFTAYNLGTANNNGAGWIAIGW